VLFCYIVDEHILLDSAERDHANISSVACRTLDKLLTECQKFCPSIDTLPSLEAGGSMLVTDLSRGLFHSLNHKRYCLQPAKPYASSSVRWFIIPTFSYDNPIYHFCNCGSGFCFSFACYS